MNQLKWGRIFLCGLVLGGIWNIMSVALLTLVGDDFLAAVSNGHTRGLRAAGPFLHFASFIDGIWAMWLYAAISSRYGRGPRTAAAAGLALWVIVSMQSAKWVALVSVPLMAVLPPLAATLPAIVLATIAGAWCYDAREPLVLGRRSVLKAPSAAEPV